MKLLPHHGHVWEGSATCWRNPARHLACQHLALPNLLVHPFPNHGKVDWPHLRKSIHVLSHGRQLLGSLLWLLRTKQPIGWMTSLPFVMPAGTPGPSAASPRRCQSCLGPSCPLWPSRLHTAANTGGHWIVSSQPSGEASQKTSLLATPSVCGGWLSKGRHCKDPWSAELSPGPWRSSGCSCGSAAPSTRTRQGVLDAGTPSDSATWINLVECTLWAGSPTCHRVTSPGAWRVPGTDALDWNRDLMEPLENHPPTITTTTRSLENHRKPISDVFLFQCCLDFQHR